MCTTCDRLLPTVPVNGPAAYRRLLARATAAILEGELEDLGLDGTPEGTQPRTHTFSCTQCAQVFLLRWHSGTGRDHWQPVQGN